MSVSTNVAEAASHAHDAQGWELVKDLVRSGSAVDAICQGDRCKSALHYAVEKGSVDLVEFLLDSGANVDMTDSLGQTPLHLAAFHPIRLTSEKLSSLLLARGADSRAKTSNGRTPHDLGWLGLTCRSLGDLAGMAQLPDRFSLRVVDFSGLNIKAFPSFPCPNLEVLTLSSNPGIVVPAINRTSPNLRQLTLRRCDLFRVEPGWITTEMELLDVSKNPKLWDLPYSLLSLLRLNSNLPPGSFLFNSCPRIPKTWSDWLMEKNRDPSLSLPKPPDPPRRSSRTLPNQPEQILCASIIDFVEEDGLTLYKLELITNHRVVTVLRRYSELLKWKEKNKQVRKQDRKGKRPPFPGKVLDTEPNQREDLLNAYLFHIFEVADIDHSTASLSAPLLPEKRVEELRVEQ